MCIWPSDPRVFKVAHPSLSPCSVSVPDLCASCFPYRWHMPLRRWLMCKGNSTAYAKAILPIFLCFNAFVHSNRKVRIFIICWANCQSMIYVFIWAWAAASVYMRLWELYFFSIPRQVSKETAHCSLTFCPRVAKSCIVLLKVVRVCKAM